MTFQHPEWIFFAVPLLLIAVGVRFWRRHYWGHPLVEQFRTEIGRPNPILRLPTILEAAAVVFLLVGLLGPVYPFVLSYRARRAADHDRAGPLPEYGKTAGEEHENGRR